MASPICAFNIVWTLSFQTGRGHISEVGGGARPGNEARVVPCVPCVPCERACERAKLRACVRACEAV